MRMAFTNNLNIYLDLCTYVENTYKTSYSEHMTAKFLANHKVTLFFNATSCMNNKSSYTDMCICLVLSVSMFQWQLVDISGWVYFHAFAQAILTGSQLAVRWT